MKTHVIGIRVSLAALDVIFKAASKDYRSISQFCRVASMEKARKILGEPEPIPNSDNQPKEPES